MSTNSKIAWTDATWNPFRGCTRISPGCQNCYAERMAARGLPGLNSPTTGEPFAIITPSGPRWTNYVEPINSQLDVTRHWKRPRRIFVNSMSDTFHAGFSDDEIELLFCEMVRHQRHTYIVLTKRSDRMRRLLWRSAWWAGTIAEYRRHIHLGVSCEDQQRFDDRIEDLRATPAAVRWLSLEPLLEPINLAGKLAGIHWVVVGGESGPSARPCHVEWVRDIVRQCRDAGVACFVKQLGRVVVGDPAEFPTAIHDDGDGHRTFRLIDPKGGDPAEWPDDLRVQEYPR